MQLFNQTASANVQFSGGTQTTLAAGGLGAAEKVEILIHDGQGYVPLIDFESGEAVTLTQAKPHRVIYGVGLYRAKKDATAAAVSCVYY
ncbi:hypothetical protein CPT_Summit_007 [Stenotrophomonas phage Summit]|nr:hypothetical protein CPT_Summit_007 [Stenotrophomonas phage Summit]